MIQAVIDLNNKGVRHLRCGDHELARQSFKEALERTTHLLALKQKAEQEMLRSNESSTEHVDASSGKEPMAIDEQNASPSSRLADAAAAQNASSLPGAALDARARGRDTDHERDESFFLSHNAVLQVSMCPSLALQQVGGSFLCDQVFLLSRNCCAHPIANEYCHRESAIIMYNLGLVNHWRGMRYGITSLLYKAQRLYEMSFSLIQHNPTTFETYRLQLALLNNMGHIHFELMRYARAERCFDLLKRTLVPASNRQLLQPEILQGFLMNVMFLEAPDTAPAA